MQVELRDLHAAFAMTTAKLADVTAERDMLNVKLAAYRDLPVPVNGALASRVNEVILSNSYNDGTNN
jgi:hypothetical protein